MLPLLKRDFPKCVYLDQNAWIALARTENGLDDGRFAPALEALERSVALGTVIAPLSDIHILETLAPADRDRRRRLAATMVRLSRNLAMRPARVVGEAEISLAVTRMLGVEIDYEIRPRIVVEGIVHALTDGLEITGPPSVVAEAEAHVRSPKFTTWVLTDDDARRSTRSLRSRETSDAAEQDIERREALARLSKDRLLQVDVFSLISRQEVTQRIEHTLSLLGRARGALNSKLASFEQHLAFIRCVSTMDVLLTLSQQRFIDVNHAPHRNDAKDIGFLRVAIPYANIVVTEKYWGHVSNTVGLASRYTSTVISSLAALPRVLKSEGCLRSD